MVKQPGSPSAGLVRTFLPGALIAPAAIAAVIFWGHRMQWYGTTTRLVLMIVANTALATGILLIAAERLGREHRKLGVAREQVAEQFADLTMLRGRFEAFMANTPAISFIKDSEGYYLYLNHSPTDVPPEELLGKTAFDWMPDETARAMRERELDVMRTGKPSQYVEQIPSATGPLEWYLLLRFPLDLPDERRFLGGIAVNISDRVRAEEQVRRLNAELEERVRERTAQLERANQELESFSYSVSHDLRSPLRAIDGYSRMLLEDYSKVLDAEGRRLLNVVRQNTSRMAELIDDLLSFSRLTRQPLQMAAIVDLTEMARSLFSEIEASARDRKIVFQAFPTAPVEADRSLLRQVLQNLISNAVKFTAPREQARIEFGGRVEGHRAVYFVSDNGVGFDMQYAGKLFSVFQRLHHTDEFEGTGVGLAIVKHIVERHGGEVWAEAELDRGARFYFALPRQIRGAARPRSELHAVQRP